MDKPSGLLSVPGKGPEKADCLAARVRRAFPSASGPLVVHRLDFETSGLVVFGLDPDAQRELSRQFERRIAEKGYIALVEPPPRGDHGRVDFPMRADVDRRPYQILDREHGRPAVTQWSLLAVEVDRARLRLTPLTGRTHQLRVHCAHREGLGSPIVGDPLYGPDPAPSDRLMLHASFLAFTDPGGGGRVEFQSTPPF